MASACVQSLHTSCNLFPVGQICNDVHVGVRCAESCCAVQEYHRGGDAPCQCAWQARAAAGECSVRAEPLFCTQAEVPLNQRSCPPCPPVGRFPHGRVARKMISFSAAPERKIWKKFKPSINRLSKDELLSCKDNTATSWSASQLSQQSHLWGAGSDGRRPSEQQRADLLLWATSQPNNRAARKHLHGQRKKSKHALKAIF